MEVPYEWAGMPVTVSRDVGKVRVCEPSGGSYPVHDHGYKLLFENVEILRSLLVDYCLFEWAGHSDVRLTAVYPAMIQGDLRASMADKLFWLAGDEVGKSGYALVEFKSSAEQDTFLQMLEFEVGILRMMINLTRSQKVQAGEHVIDPIIHKNLLVGPGAGIGVGRNDEAVEMVVRATAEPAGC